MTWQAGIFLGSITVDSSNNRINITNSGTGINKTFAIAPGTYYLRPDPAGTDSSSIFYGIRTATDIASPFTATPASHVGMTTGSTVSFNTLSGVRCAVVTMTTTSNTVWRWGVAATTFDPGQLGFASADTASSTSAASTLSASTVWVSSDVFSRRLPRYRLNASGSKTHDGIYSAKKRGAIQKEYTFQFDNVSGDRVNLPENGSASLMMPLVTFIDRYINGEQFEVWWSTHSSGTTLYNLGNGTLGTHYDRIGNAWHFDAETMATWEPQWPGEGADLWDIELSLFHYEG